MKSKVSHDELGVIAGKWLKRNGVSQQVTDGRYPASIVTVINKLMYNSEYPDVIGFIKMADWSIIVEVKTSRSDFLRDHNKIVRTSPNFGMGNFRYYCCPDGLIKKEELPDKWGLLYLCKGKIKEIVEPKHIEVVNNRAERYLMLYYLRFPDKFAQNKV